MPLYKLTEKRMKKRAREDEAGITQMKAALREMGDEAGNETASEGWSESDSDSEDEGDEDEEGENEDDEDDEGSEGEDEDEDEEGDGDLDVDIDGLEASDDSEDEDDDMVSDVGSSSSSIFPISLESALTSPIYNSREIPTDQLCVLCPDKSMKNEHMVEVHLGSKGHKRASKRYALRLTTNPPDPNSDPREIVADILADIDDGVPPASTTLASAPGTTDAELQSGGDQKRKRTQGKKERKEIKAKSLIEVLKAGTTPASLTKTITSTGSASVAGASTQKGSKKSQKANSEKGDAKVGGEGVKLNRKARRLLAIEKGQLTPKGPTPVKKAAGAKTAAA